MRAAPKDGGIKNWIERRLHRPRDGFDGPLVHRGQVVILPLCLTDLRTTDAPTYRA